MIRLCSLFLFVAALLLCTAALASDLARERRMAEEIADAIVEGDPVYLQAGDARFLGIHTRSNAPAPRGAAIILHGRGLHPDWAEVVAPLRTALPRYGWHTLSLQMPVLAKDATYYDYLSIFPEAFPRLRAGIEYLRAQGITNIVLIAHSCGAHMAMAWMERYGDADIHAFVGIGMGATDLGQPMLAPFPLDRMRVPVLDIFGGDDYPAVLRGAPQRVDDMRRAGNPKSRQIVIPGADHYFRSGGDALVEAVGSWLNQLRP